MATWRKILCAVDFSESSRDAMEEAADLARRGDAELSLVHAFEVPAPDPDAVASPPELFEQTRLELDRKLESWRAEAERRCGRPVREVVLGGEAAREVARFAREGGYDLLVVGTHGRTGIRRLVLGSVAERLVRQAHCPVLVVRRTGAP